MTYHKITFFRVALTFSVPLLVATGLASFQRAAVETTAFRSLHFMETQTTKGSIRLSVEQIPTIDFPLRVFRLTAQRAPAEFIERFLPSVAPNAKQLEPLAQLSIHRKIPPKNSENLVGAVDGDHLAAYADLESGDALVLPTISRLKPLRGIDEANATRLAEDLISRSGVIGKDETRVTAGNVQMLARERAVNESTTGVRTSLMGKANYLTLVHFRRYVDRYAVYGPGSRALLALGQGASLQGFIRRWKIAAVSDTVAETRSRDEVAREIRTQLEQAARNSDVEVLSVKVGYYDANRGYLQPVYRFTSRVHHLETGPVRNHHLQTPVKKESLTDDDYLIGYVHVGREYEELPSLLRSPRQQPTSPPGASIKEVSPFDSVAQTPPLIQQVSADDPTIGCYIVRNDNENWSDDAEEFSDGLTSTSSRFTLIQNVWAFPDQFVGKANPEINNVNVAITEAHGNWWLFTTYMNNGDIVHITDIPSTGYGGAGHRLRYWIIHSCEVIPTGFDLKNYAARWWHVFSGLHSIVSYRTIMRIDDDVSGPFAEVVALGVPFASAWIFEVSNADAYDDDDRELNHANKNLLMGRPATISACGHVDDSIYNLKRAGKNCLWFQWIDG